MEREITPAQAARIYGTSDEGKDWAPEPVRERRDFMPPKHPMMQSANGLRLLLRILPGLAESFDREVPGSHLSTSGDLMYVACTCRGAHDPEDVSPTPIMRNEITGCEEGCGRWFMRTGDDVVLVARFPLEDAA